MNTDLQKRLEEAAKEYAHRQGLGDLNQHEVWLYKAGAEQGFKEAIAQVKEWLKEQGKDWWEGYGLPFSLADFETYMNKLWEEKK